MKKPILLAFIFLLSHNVFSQLKIKVGDAAPKLNITDYLANVPADKNLENKYILLEFWATWCTTCLEQVPHINELNEKYKDRKDFAFLSITDESPQKTKNTLKKFKFNTVVISDQTKKALNDFVVDGQDGSYSIPKTILIDNKGIIRWIGQPYYLNEVIINKFSEGKEILVTDKTVLPDMPSEPIFIKQ